MKIYYERLIPKYISEKPVTNESTTSNCNCNWCTTRNEMKSAKPLEPRQVSTYQTLFNSHKELLQQLFNWKSRINTEKAAYQSIYNTILEQLNNLAAHLDSLQRFPIQIPFVHENPCNENIKIESADGLKGSPFSPPPSPTVTTA